MKKFVVISTLVVALFFAFTACGSNSEVQESAGVTEPPHTPNPFAIPLLDFFAEGLQLPEYYEQDSTKAILVDMDGNGGYVVIAARHVLHDDGISPVLNYRIFRVDNSYLDIAHNDEHLVFITINSDGLPIISTHPADTVHSFTPIEMENGDLIFPFTIQRHWNDGEFQYIYIDGGLFFGWVPEGINRAVNWDTRRYITEEEFDEIMLAYNLGGSWMMMLDDETEAILAMTFE